MIIRLSMLNIWNFRYSDTSFRTMATSRAPSFVKKGQSKTNQIPGTKVSLQNSQLLISSGISSFDSVIGGGLPVGSLVLIEEDFSGSLAKIIMKYFLAEGVLSNQALHVCSKDVDPSHLINELPGTVEQETSDPTGEGNRDEEMTIAWRYQNMKVVSSVCTSQLHFCHYFDLMKTMDEGLIKDSDISYWTNKEDMPFDTFEETDYASLLKSIKEKLEKEEYLVTSTANERKILRLGLCQIGSPLWPINHLPVFFYFLRALLRNSYATCMVTVPFHIYKNNSIKEQCIHLSDICVHLQSFAGTPLEDNVSLKDYNGFFQIVKWAPINGLINGGAQTDDLAVKLRRRKLVIEKLHLPPDLDDTVQREQDSSGFIGCGSAKGKLLEF